MCRYDSDHTATGDLPISLFINYPKATALTKSKNAVSFARVMIRKSLVSIILLSMVLHCAGRLGVISYLYQQRHSIAHSIGLIAEVPIAMCNSDFDFGKGLTFVNVNQDDQLPASMSMAQEINLFLSWPSLESSPEYFKILDRQLQVKAFQNYTPPSFPIFHPPV